MDRVEGTPWVHNRILWFIMDALDVLSVLSLVAAFCTLGYRLWSVTAVEFFRVLGNTKINELFVWALSQGPWYANPFIYLAVAVLLHAISYVCFLVHLWMNRNWDRGVRKKR